MPIVVLGIVFKDVIESDLRSLWVVGSTLVVLGLVLGLAEYVGRRTRPLDTLGWRSAVLLGLSQALALVPGVSRSGATISMGLFLGFEREAATRFAFLLAIPAVVGAGAFELRDAIGADSRYSPAQTLLATVVAFVIGYATIAWLLRYVATRSYTPFVVYRVLLGSSVLVLLATGVLTT